MQGEIEFNEFHAWWVAGGLDAGGDYEGMVGSRSPALAELQMWLFRRGLADFTRCFLACGITSMLALYELNQTKLTKLCIDDVGLSRRQADSVIKEIVVRRDLLGYSSTDQISDAAEQRLLEDKKRKVQRRKRRLERRDWHNRLEVNGDAHGPTYHNTTHKPLSCFCLPASLDRMDKARERAKGRRQPQDVQTKRRSQIVPTAGNTVQSLTTTQRDSAQQLNDLSGSFNEFAMTSVSSLRPNLSSLSLGDFEGRLQGSWSLPDISSSTSLASSSLVKSLTSSSLGASSPTSANMFASVASGGRRRTNRGRIRLSPKRSTRKQLGLSVPSARSTYGPEMADVRQQARRQLNLDVAGGDPTLATTSIAACNTLSSTHDSAPRVENAHGSAPQPKTMQDWIQHLRNPIPEEFFIAGCPGL